MASNKTYISYDSLPVGEELGGDKSEQGMAAAARREGRNHNAANDINNNINNYYYYYALLVPLKVFDTLNHDLSLTKLERYGVRGPCHMLMRLYQTERTQFVGAADCKSTEQ